MLSVLESPESAAAAAADAIADAIAEAIVRSGRCDLALSGGRAAGLVFDRLAAAAASGIAGSRGGAAARPRGGADWSRVTIFFADERAVPPDHPDSNYRLARERLLDPLDIPAARVHRMPADAGDLDAAALAYEAVLAAPLDVLMLGMGEDGHTASLFPGSRLVNERERRVATVHDSPKPPPRRLTVTPRVLAEARRVIVLATGAEKAGAALRALEGETPAREIPVRLVRDREWFLDRAAAARLTHSM